MVKVCRQCDQEQPLSNFYKEKRNKDGLKHFCKSCIIQKTKTWKECNPNKVIVQKNKYYELNKKKESARTKKYRASNKDKINGYKRKRRALTLGNEHNQYTLQQVIDTYGLDCYICDNPIDIKAPRQAGKDNWELGLHLDHFIPLSKGGADNLSNVRPSHGVCNLKKGSKVV